MDDPDFEKSHSVTQWIERLKEDDPQAAAQVWQRFFERLIPMARARLRGLTDRSVDEEDLLVSVFDRFFQAARENRFAQLNDRDDLWQILLMLTSRRVSEQYRKSNAQRRGGGRVQQLGDVVKKDDELRELAEGEPGPEFVVTFNDSLSLVLSHLKDQMTKDVAVLRLEGYANQEIAVRLKISLSSVERKLRVVREAWQEEFNVDS